MKILVNGYTFGECLLVRNDNEIAILNKTIGHIKKVDKNKYMKLVLLVALFIIPHANVGWAATTCTYISDYSIFDSAGNTIFSLVVSIAKWVFIAKGGWEVIQKLASGCDVGDVSEIITKYGMGYGAIILLPKILNMLESAISTINF